MINLLYSLGLALVVALGMRLLHIHLLIAVPVGLIAGMALFIYLGRRVQNQLEAIFNRASELLKKQKFDPAIEVMKEAYAYSRQQFMVKSSVDGQIGVIQYLRGKQEEAEPLLKSANMRHYIAKAMLGVMQWKRKETKAAIKTFELCLRTAKKESLLYAVYAYILKQMGERDKAIEVLNRGLQICKGDERLQTNLVQLQNNKDMKMKVYGEQWYQFMIERPRIRIEPPPYARISKKMMRG